MSYRNGLIYDLIIRLFDRTADKLMEKMKLSKHEESAAIVIVPNNNPDRFYQDWIEGDWEVLNDLPETQITIKSCGRLVDEIVQIIMADDPLVTHTGHDDKTCPGEPLSEGLRKLLSGQSSTWQVRYAIPRIFREFKPKVGRLELFLVQEFEGNVPGKPNRDICRFCLGKELAPMELEIRIPHYGVKDGFCTVTYLKIDLEIDPEAGVVVIGHEDNMDPRPE